MELIAPAKEEEKALIYLRASLSQRRRPGYMDVCVRAEYQFVPRTFNQRDL